MFEGDFVNKSHKSSPLVIPAKAGISGIAGGVNYLIYNLNFFGCLFNRFLLN
jgi:hypothetical protein